MKHLVDLNSKEKKLIGILIEYLDMMPEINQDVKEMSKIKDFEQLKVKITSKMSDSNCD